MNFPNRRDTRYKESRFEKYQQDSDYYFDAGYNEAISDFHKWIDKAPIEELIMEHQDLSGMLEDFNRTSQAIRVLLKGEK